MQKDYEKILNFLYSQEDLPQSLREKLDLWLLSHEEDQELVEGMYSLWEMEIRKSHSEINPESLGRILQEVGDTPIATNKFESDSKSIWRKWMTYAAVVSAIVLSVLATLVVSNRLQPQITVLATAEGSRGEFKLPDGTAVTLNGGSKLTYNANDFGKRGKRNVSVEGDAYFDVAKDKSHPFEVMLGGSCVVVTGTKFEVRNYPYSNYEEVVLESGSVNITELEDGKKVALHPDQRFILDRKNNEWMVENTEASKYCRWIQRCLKLENEPIGDLLVTIGRKYGVEVRISPEVDLDETLTITLQNDELEDILSIISYLTGNGYNLQGHELEIYAKR